jgi:plasmid stabilization system protein ParE
VHQVCENVLERPTSYHRGPGGHRRANVHGFPYHIAFFIEKERILVVAVSHNSREPEYWKSRIE